MQMFDANSKLFSDLVLKNYDPYNPNDTSSGNGVALFDIEGALPTGDTTVNQNVNTAKSGLQINPTYLLIGALILILWTLKGQRLSL